MCLFLGYGILDYYFLLFYLFVLPKFYTPDMYYTCITITPKQIKDYKILNFLHKRNQELLMITRSTNPLIKKIKNWTKLLKQPFQGLWKLTKGKHKLRNIYP